MHQSFVSTAPQPREIAGTFTFFPAKPHTAGFVHVTQISGISPSLWGQCKSRNTAHFHGYPSPRARGGGRGGMTSALFVLKTMDHNCTCCFSYSRGLGGGVEGWGEAGPTCYLKHTSHRMDPSQIDSY